MKTGLVMFFGFVLCVSPRLAIAEHDVIPEHIGSLESTEQEALQHLALEFKANKAVYQQDEDIVLEAIWTNVANEDVTVDEQLLRLPGFPSYDARDPERKVRQHSLDVRDTRGKSVELSDQQSYEPYEQPVHMIVLKPGDSYRRRQNITGFADFDQLEPGEYTIALKQDETQRYSRVGEPVRIKVTK